MEKWNFVNVENLEEVILKDFVKNAITLICKSGERIIQIQKKKKWKIVQELIYVFI